MNWIIITFALFLGSTSLGFAAANETEPKKTEPKTAISPVLGGAYTLPGLKGLSLMNEAYSVVNVAAEIPSKLKKYSKIKVSATDESQLLLELVSGSPEKEVAYVLDIGLINGYNIDVKLEWTDANYDQEADELVIWWNTADGNNGIYDGYEMERAGVLILNINDMQDIVNFTFNDQNRSYSASENADTESDDFHGKSDDNSIWEICAYSYDLKLKDGDLYLSNLSIEKEGESECEVATYKEGKFTYDYSTGMFELTQ